MNRSVILDTSAIIKDPMCFKGFGSSEVFIPLTVIEELDHIKEKTGETSAKARRFIKELDKMSGGALINYPGVEVGEGRLSIIHCNDDLCRTTSGEALDFDKADNRILSACMMAMDVSGSEKAVLISEDRNLRLKAQYMGLEAEGYVSTECQCKGVQCLDDVPIGIIEDLYNSSAGIDPALTKVNPAVNSYTVLRNGSASVLVRCFADGLVRKVKRRDAYGITPRNAEQIFAMDALFDREVDLVTVTGKAGTGKTLLALAAALEQRSQYRQIMLARPIAIMGQDVGYLPGDLKEKLAPYMQPLFDNLAVIKAATGDKAGTGDKIGKMMEDQKIVIEPLTEVVPKIRTGS